MKQIKKIAGLLLALVMVFAMAATAFAADTTITGRDNDRTYEIYQIFTGDLSENTLSNVKWGQNAKGHTAGDAVDATVLDALAAVNSSSYADILDAIENYVDLSGKPYTTVTGDAKVTVPTGYYLIKDLGEVDENGESSVPSGEGYSLYLVQIVGPTTISPKTGTTTSEKKVDDKNDSNTSEDTTTWQDSADYDIGDVVPFQLKATVADDYANYKVYQLVFHDKESNGLTFNNDAKVFVDDVEITTGFTVNTAPTDGDTFEVVFDDLKQIGSVKAGSVITVQYTSELNENAVIGSAGNPNTMHIEYSNNPNDEQGGETGTTPDDTVIVFTYKVVVNKVDEDNQPLKGAGFTLYKKDSTGTYNAVGDELTGTDLTQFEWKGLDDGYYKLVETTTPAGYNTMADIEFTITASHDVLSDNPALTALSGNVTSGTATFTAVTDTCSLTTDVVNKEGSTLPETGGIGTTIFYVLGGVLVIAAGVLLITRRRMRSER